MGGTTMATGDTMTARGRMAMGGTTATGYTTMRHDGGNARHNDGDG